MTNKQRFIKAHKKHIEILESNDTKKFGKNPLCAAAGRKNKSIICRPCTLATESGTLGCILHKTLNYLQPMEWTPEQRKARADTHRKYIEIIEKFPEERFTDEGWEYIPKPEGA